MKAKEVTVSVFASLFMGVQFWFVNELAGILMGLATGLVLYWSIGGFTRDGDA